MNKNILVVGSISIDHTIYTKTLPQAGVTTAGESFFKNVGGKGANQACAIHYLGAPVFFYGAVGNDEEGKYAANFLKEQGLNHELKISKRYKVYSFKWWRNIFKKRFK